MTSTPPPEPVALRRRLLGSAYLAVAVIRMLYPRLTPAQASDIVVPRHASQPGAAQEHAAYDGAASPAGRQDTTRLTKHRPGGIQPCTWS